MSIDTPRCKHDIGEMETASYADGMCPLCLASQVEKLTAERDRERNAGTRAQLTSDDLANRCMDLRGQLQHAVAELAKAREACAQTVLSLKHPSNNAHWNNACDYCADAIIALTGAKP